MTQQRSLDKLYRSLGLDPTGLQPEMDRTVSPVYVLDDLVFALPNRSTVRMLANLVSSAAAGELSGFEFNPPPTGVWIRRFYVTGAQNCLLSISAAGLATITTFDVLPTVIVMEPEDAIPLTDAAALGQFVRGSGFQLPGKPVLFDSFVMGHGLPVIANSIFLQGGLGEKNQIPDLWIPPGTKVRFQNGVVNASISVALDLEFPPGLAIF